MSIQQYLDNMKNIYNLVIDFIDGEEEEEDNDDENFQRIIDSIKSRESFKNRDEWHEILLLINKISKHHHRNHGFFEKIEKILTFYENETKQTFSNIELFQIFKNNKRILLFLFQKEFIIVDENICNFIKKKNNDYNYYFFNFIEEFLSDDEREEIKKQIGDEDPDIIEEKRQTGENDDYLCYLIREDLVQEFITFVNQQNISVNSNIKESIYETNPLLIKNMPITLIEYAAFFGSIQIFNFLRINNAYLNPCLCNYAIHSRNAEIIHYLEENHIIYDNDNYFNFFEESIKCHHNEIVNYVLDNLIEEKISDGINNYENEYNMKKSQNNNFLTKLKSIFVKQDENDKKDHIVKKFLKICIRYHNYEYIPNISDSNIFLKYYCSFGYTLLVKLFIQENKINIKEKLIKQSNFFHQTIKTL